MASTMPLIPRVLFQFLEPISLAAGLWVAWSDPDLFINDQYVATGSAITNKIVANSTNAKMLAFQLGNLYGLLGLIGIMIFSLTSEPKVIKGYIFACAVGDVGHVVPAMLLMGLDKSLDVANWNAMAWGNIGVTVILFTLRSLYLLGAFGSHPSAVAVGKKRA